MEVFFPVLIKFLDKETHMLFVSGIVLGILLGAAGSFAYLFFTKQLKG